MKQIDDDIVWLSRVILNAVKDLYATMTVSHFVSFNEVKNLKSDNWNIIIEILRDAQNDTTENVILNLSTQNDKKE